MNIYTTKIQSSELTKQKISTTLKGKKFTDERRQNIRNGLLKYNSIKRLKQV